MSVRHSRWERTDGACEGESRARKRACCPSDKERSLGTVKQEKTECLTAQSASSHALAAAMASRPAPRSVPRRKDTEPTWGKGGDHFVGEDEAQKLFDEFHEEEEEAEKRDGAAPDSHKHARQDGKDKGDDVVRASRNFIPSGKLKEDTALKYKGRVLMFDEPQDAAVPVFKKDGRWRIYVFKGKERIGEPLILQNGSCFLLGRDREIVDIPLDHPTCSSQHAVLQYRQVCDADGQQCIKLYIMDLGSTNGTFLNGDKLKPRVYVELLEKDIVKFALSTREYIFVKEFSS